MALTVGWASASLVLALAAGVVFAQTSMAVPRWGQASAILNDKLLISGGKIDLQHQFTYTSAPNCNDLLSLDLSTSFPLSSPPWSYISGSQNSSTSQGPAVAFHTLTPYTSSELFLFGGDSGFNTIQTNADSAWLLNVKDLMSPSWSSRAAGWASEPIRRIYHAAPSASGAIYILGGQKADGSQIGFPDPYLFNAVADSGSPAFIPLTGTTSAPAGLFGHAAHVLPGGKLFVFGGFFSSGSAPNTPSPLSIIYALDTTSASPTWSIQNATGGTTPIPRRGFASALLNDGKILIHGGADATIQTLYSDAAILDTTQTPMIWSPVDGLSDILGPRVGHFAAPIHGQILFGFGWAGNAPANANLALYDLTSGAFQPNYKPALTPASITTLPVSPTSPGGTYPSSGANTGQGGSGTSTGSGIGSSPSSGSGSGKVGGGGGGQVDGSKNPQSTKTGLVVGSVLGFFVFVGLVGGGVYYGLRQRERHARRFNSNIPQNPEIRWRLIAEESPWDATLDESPTQPGTSVQMAGTRWHDQPRRGWGIPALGALIGVGATTTGRRRLDMLADEDVRQFDIDSVLHNGEGDTWSYEDDKSRRGTRRQGTGGSSVSIEKRNMNSGRSPWNEIWNASVTSLKNVGVAFGVTAAASPAAREGRDGVNRPEWWEKDELPLDPFQDPAPVIESGSGLIKINPLVGTNEKSRMTDGASTSGSGAFPTLYADPFADPHESEAHVGDVRATDTASLPGDAHEEHAPSVLGGGQSSQSSLPRSFGVMELARVGNASPGSSDRDRGTSVESHDAPSSQTTPSIHTGTSVTLTPTDQSSSVNSLTSPRTTSIVGAITTPSVPMRRSDSWWSRFSRTSFLDRHSIHDASHRNVSIGGLAEFRDPNPAPRLGAIQESTHPSREATEDLNLPSVSTSGGGPSKVGLQKAVSGYAASTKSSIRTANSELIEGIDGRVEVVQRALSLTSRGTASPLTTDSLDDLHKWGSSSMGASSSDETHRQSWTMSDGEPDLFVAESPTTYLGDGLSPNARTGVSVPPPSDPSGLSMGGVAQQRHRPPRRALMGTVATRVSAYERRLSQDALTQSPPLGDQPHLKNERSRRSGVGYGLVPKASLFVANPDRRNASGSN